MAKDRRNGGRATRPEVTKKQFLVKVALLLLAVLIVIVGLIFLASHRRAAAPADGTPAETTTTTVNREQTTTTTLLTTTVMPTDTTTTVTSTTTTTSTTAATTSTTKAVMSGPTDLRLVNPWNPMTKQAINSQNLVHYSDGYYLDAKVVGPLNAMLEAGSEYGLYVTSAYRSYDTQQGLYDNKVQRVINATGMSYEDALVEAATVVAKPGTSEHHTGLAVDLLHEDCYELEEYWDQSPAFDWMKKHCAEYGFILRYPKSKQSVTGVIYEPWHYRYVGVEAATEIMARGITLEEYLGRA